jgi:hypothetical protein
VAAIELIATLSHLLLLAGGLSVPSDYPIPAVDQPVPCSYFIEPVLGSALIYICSSFYYTIARVDLSLSTSLSPIAFLPDTVVCKELNL